ncbi:MAG: hypothetical protein ACRBBN_19525 [Methyloligellaceae bacterium]
MFKKLVALGAVAMVGGIMMIASSNPAEAGRKRCVFMAHNPFNGHMIADGWAKAIKKSTACKRAKRRCNRELNRKRRQGKSARGAVCRRITNL